MVEERNSRVCQCFESYCRLNAPGHLLSRSSGWPTPTEQNLARGPMNRVTQNVYIVFETMETRSETSYTSYVKAMNRHRLLRGRRAPATVAGIVPVPEIPTEAGRDPQLPLRRWGSRRQP